MISGYVWPFSHLFTAGVDTPKYSAICSWVSDNFFRFFPNNLIDSHLVPPRFLGFMIAKIAFRYNGMIVKLLICKINQK